MFDSLTLLWEWLAPTSDITLAALLLLFCAAVFAGWVDAIGGGGGLIAVPALMSVGMTPLQALATNKLQAVFGSGTAAWQYSRQGLVRPSELKLAIILTFVGAALGTWSVQQLDSDVLTQVVPVLLIAFAVYFWFSPDLGAMPSRQLVTYPVFALLMGGGIGFYDGFFGPGTGTFFVMAFMLLYGQTLMAATGQSKVLNFTSNIAALCMFAWAGQVVWLVGLVMALGQVIGSYIGARMVLRQGARLIRPILVVVSVLVSLKLLLA